VGNLVEEGGKWLPLGAPLIETPGPLASHLIKLTLPSFDFPSSLSQHSQFPQVEKLSVSPRFNNTKHLDDITQQFTMSGAV
jgi:hypothetical protein